MDIAPRVAHRLAAKLDDVLRRPEATVDWISLPWLHLLNEHPEQMKRYAALAHRLGDLDPDLAGQWAGARKGLRAPDIAPAVVRRLIRGLASKKQRASPPPTRSYDVVILSALVNPDHLSADDDFYFGHLQSSLQECGVSSMLILRNHTKIATSTLAAHARREGDQGRMLLPDSLGLPQELDGFMRGVRVRRQLRSAAVASEPYAAAVLEEASRMAVSGAALTGFGTYTQLLQNCRVIQPKVAITLYEGHAVEHVFWHAARAVNPAVLCVGYQHTTVWQHTHAIFRSVGHDGIYDPDVILTLGDVTRRLLEASLPSKRRVMTLGTHRRGEIRDRPTITDRPCAVLVVPEGYESECLLLFGAALECARSLPDVRFIFRNHPVMPFERIRGALGESGLNNVEISVDRTMEEDFARSRFCLYRGSSTVLHAILWGLKPFYLRLPGERSIDPVYELDTWRETVESAAELIATLRRQCQVGYAPDADSFATAWAYCDEYIRPYDGQVVQRLMDETLASQ